MSENEREHNTPPPIVTTKDLWIEIKNIQEDVNAMYTKLEILTEKNMLDHKYIWEAIGLLFAIIAFISGLYLV